MDPGLVGLDDVAESVAVVLTEQRQIGATFERGCLAMFTRYDRYGLQVRDVLPRELASGREDELAPAKPADPPRSVLATADQSASETTVPCFRASRPRDTRPSIRVVPDFSPGGQS